ncbi:MAG: ATP-binding protein [Propionibacteriaceae bacterium]|nr:ATP-binding protein [Propionibacteriaceae bacterium]
MSTSTLTKPKPVKAKPAKSPKPAKSKVVGEPESVVRPKRGRPYALRSVIGNCTLTNTAVTAWYTLAQQSVAFKPDSQVEAIIEDGGAALADLVGQRVYVRVTTRPVSVADIANRTWADATRAGAGPLPGAVEMLVREQNRLVDADLSEKYVFMGVRIATARRYPSDPRREIEWLAPQLEVTNQILSKPGLMGRPSTSAEMDLLLRRSVAIGLPLPPPDTHVVGDWDTDDLPALTEDVLVTTEPWAKTAEVSIWDTLGNPQRNRVAVLTMGRVGDMDIPQDGQGGWIHRTDRLPFPIEFMATIDVLPDDRVNGRVRHQIDTIVDQYKHYTVEHGKPAPRSLARQNERALEVEDQLSAGLGGLATRTDGWYRMAIWGQDEPEIKDKVAVIQNLYGRQIEWWWSSGQYDLVREFVPGEPLANSAQRRCLTAPSVMAALPAATAQIGDGYGALVGASSGTSMKAFLWALWLDMERRNRSGLAILTGGLGSGKSVLAGLLVYMTSMMGATWTIFDPSGRLGKLCSLPELRDWSRHINLLSGRDGELSPYRVLLDPRSEHFRDTRRSDIENRAEYESEMEAVAAQRTALCLDVLTSLLPKVQRQDAKALSVLRSAVTAVPGARTSSPGMVLAELRKIVQGESKTELAWTQEHRIVANDIYTELSTFAATPKGRLVFGQASGDDTGMETPDGRRRVLTVYSLNGLTMPTPRQLEMGDESSSTRQSKALFNLAAWLTQQSIYLGDPNERKGLLIDEGHMLAEFEEGAALIDKTSVDSRKHNVRFLLCSQNVNHFDIDRIAPLASAVIVGRTTDPKSAADALRLCGLAEDPSLIASLGRLTQELARVNPDEQQSVPHEFLFSTKDLGQVEKITVWGDEHSDVMEALDTTPGGQRTEEANYART